MPALLVDLFQEGCEFGKTKIFSVALFPTEQAEHFRILDDEDRILIGDWCVKERVREPVQRGDLFFIHQAQRLFAVNDKERIARNRIERFNAPADQDRNLSELRKINIFTRALWRAKTRCNPQQSETENNCRNETFHAIAFRRCRENPTR